MTSVSLGVDVGGTKIAAGLLDEQGNISHVESQPVAGRGEAAVRQILEIVQEYLRRHPVAHVGVVVPGGVAPVSRTVVTAPNLGWAGLPLGSDLSALLGRAVHVENDANAAAWAEHRFGAGGRDTTVLVTVGTGIGGGVVVNDRLVVGARGLGAEFGHVPVVANGRPCVCGGRGCWEQYASGSALMAAARERSWSGAFTGEDVLAAADAGDESALKVARKVAARLAHGLIVIGTIFDPDHIVLGGGLGSDPRFIRLVDAELQGHGATLTRGTLAVRAARLGAAAGLIGAADLARSADFGRVGA